MNLRRHVTAHGLFCTTVGRQARRREGCDCLLCAVPNQTKLLCPLPAGAKLYERSGFVDAEGLTEVLVQFMEHGPKVRATHVGCGTC